MCADRAPYILQGPDVEKIDAILRRVARITRKLPRGKRLKTERVACDMSFARVKRLAIRQVQILQQAGADFRHVTIEQRHAVRFPVP